MGLKRPGRILHSVFTKLLAVMLITGLLINMMVGIFFHLVYKTFSRAPLQKSIVQYVNYLIADMGTPPDQQRAAEVAGNAGLMVTYHGPHGGWSTGREHPVQELSRIHWQSWHQEPGVRVGRFRGAHFVEVRRNGASFLFELALEKDQLRTIRWLAGSMLLIFSLIVGGAYLSIRRILRPIQWLQQGVQKVSRGDLQVTLPAKGHDELGSLARGFNQMIQRLKHMLTIREQLLLDVSHELRSPITRMKVALEFLPDSKARQTISEDLKEMETLVSEILHSARLRNMSERMTFEAVALGDLLESIVAAFGNPQPGIELQRPLPQVTVVVDPEKMKTVLTNLLNNAVKYSHPQSGAIRVTASSQTKNWLVSVTDDGIGIPPDELEKIFEPFYRADKSRDRKTGGFGLGLSICKTIMTAHGGSISIKSPPGQGTCVTLTFPHRRS
jgi:signal transduction histidine kinase